MKKKLTILTAVLNNDLDINKTAKTLLSQLNNEVEWIIKNSSDDIKNFSNEIINNTNVRIIAQNDNSLYEGLNQGLDNCQSDYVQIIGAGDEIIDGAIEKIMYAIQEFNEIDALFFPVIQNKNGRTISPTPKEMPNRMACPHPGSILKVNNIKLINGFDEKYKIASDYDLLSRYLLKWPKYVISNEIIVGYMGGGISEKGVIEAFLEEELIRIRIWKKNQNQTILNSFRFMSWAKEQVGI